jgi:hypothetical protein
MVAGMSVSRSWASIGAKDGVFSGDFGSEVGDAGEGRVYSLGLGMPSMDNAVFEVNGSWFVIRF